MEKPDSVNDRVWECACDLMRGSHHLPKKSTKPDSFNGPDGRGLSFPIHQGFATFDGGWMTYAVILAHKYGVRIEIQPAGQFLRMLITPRPLLVEDEETGIRVHPNLHDLAVRCQEAFTRSAGGEE